MRISLRSGYTNFTITAEGCIEAGTGTLARPVMGLTKLAASASTTIRSTPKMKMVEGAALFSFCLRYQSSFSPN